MLGKDYMLAIILVNCDGQPRGGRPGGAEGERGRAGRAAEAAAAVRGAELAALGPAGWRIPQASSCAGGSGRARRHLLLTRAAGELRTPNGAGSRGTLRPLRDVGAAETGWAPARRVQRNGASERCRTELRQGVLRNPDSGRGRSPALGAFAVQRKARPGQWQLQRCHWRMA